MIFVYVVLKVNDLHEQGVIDAIFSDEKEAHKYKEEKQYDFSESLGINYIVTQHVLFKNVDHCKNWKNAKSLEK